MSTPTSRTAASITILQYDRNTAARLGVTTQALDSALYSAFGQQEVSIIYAPLNQYYVVLEVAPQFWQTPEGLKYIYLNTAGAGNVPLSQPHHREDQRHTALGQSHRAVSLRHHLI